MDRIERMAGRKRPRYESSPPASSETRTPSLPGLPSRNGGQQRRYQPRDLELHDILQGQRVPGPIFDRLEARFVELKDDASYVRETRATVIAQDREIANRDNQIRQMKASREQWKQDKARMQYDAKKAISEEKDNSSKRLKVERTARVEDAQVIRELREENEELKEKTGRQDSFLKFNTKAHEDKRLEMERSSKQLASLREMVDAKDRTISNMNMRLHAMVNASGEEATQHALEAQAQRTLGMVQGLQANVADQDSKIDELQRLLAERDATIQAQDQKVKYVEEMEKRVQSAEKHAAEASALAEEQQIIIDKMKMFQGDRMQF